MNTIIFKLRCFTLLAWLVAAVVFIGAGTARAAGEAEWKKTIEAAKKEGQVSIYTESSQTSLLVDSRAFQKRFPEIKTVVAFGNTAPNAVALGSSPVPVE